MNKLEIKISAIKVVLSVSSLSGSICGNNRVVELSNNTITALDKIDTTQNEAELMVNMCLKKYEIQLQIIASQPKNFVTAGIQNGNVDQKAILDNDEK